MTMCWDCTFKFFNGYRVDQVSTLIRTCQYGNTTRSKSRAQYCINPLSFNQLPCDIISRPFVDQFIGYQVDQAHCSLSTCWYVDEKISLEWVSYSMLKEFFKNFMGGTINFLHYLGRQAIIDNYFLVTLGLCPLGWFIIVSILALQCSNSTWHNMGPTIPT